MKVFYYKNIIMYLNRWSTSNLFEKEKKRR